MNKEKFILIEKKLSSLKKEHPEQWEDFNIFSAGGMCESARQSLRKELFTFIDTFHFLIEDNKALFSDLLESLYVSGYFTDNQLEKFSDSLLGEQTNGQV